MSDSPQWAICVAYEGSGFSGFARQDGQRTVQGELEHALSIALRRPMEVVGAGRTDAGVHALRQVVSFPWHEGDPEPEALVRSVDALTGQGLVATWARHAAPDFSARFSATAREYRYRLVSAAPPLFLEKFAWYVPAELDVDAMRRSAVALVGEHDFRSFCVTASAEGKRTMRRVEVLEVIEETHLGEECLTVRIVGNAFLHSMVRVIVGTLVEVGSGRRGVEYPAAALQARDRSAAGPTAPPHGLVLHDVRYPCDVWL